MSTGVARGARRPLPHVPPPPPAGVGRAHDGSNSVRSSPRAVLRERAVQCPFGLTAGHRARPRGYPRTVERAEALDTFLAPRGIDVVIELVVGAETVMERLGLRARRDDTEAAVTSRLELYDHNTVPVLSWHEARTNLLRVDGDRRADRGRRRAPPPC